ncbi:MAG TPA: hypothetical protein VMS74_13140 [Acidimicrobiia bacterium]|nr:hypothetical protein [Acidimicrobiia bacterium]
MTMDGPRHDVPGHPLEEWTDQELIDHYRYLLAETADLPDGGSLDESPVDITRAEILRRGLADDVDEIEADASSPGREGFDPHMRHGR